LSERLLGNDYAATLRQWRDTYEQFIGIYTSDERRSKRLERLNEFFRALFIDQHPVYPLYRHWYAVLESQSEFAAPATDDPRPREEAVDNIPEIVYRNLDEDTNADVIPPRSGNIGRIVFFAVVSIASLMVIGFVGINLFNNDNTSEIALTISATPNEETQRAIINITETERSEEHTS